MEYQWSERKLTFLLVLKMEDKRSRELICTLDNRDACQEQEMNRMKRMKEIREIPMRQRK